MSQETYRVRIRFRVQKKLNIKEAERTVKVAGQDIVLSGQEPNVSISDSEWLIMNSRGFSTEQEARQFGHNLKLSLELSSVATRLGIDTGRDLATSGLGILVKEKLKNEQGIAARDNIHGLDVFIDDPNVRYINISASGVLRKRPEEFIEALNSIYASAITISSRASDIILLLNYALMQPEPVAKIIFAFSAVETLGQDESWTLSQKSLLKELANFAERSDIGDEAERLEVSNAIRNGLHRLSLRQGVMRLLSNLGLGELKPIWDKLYSERSTLVHGLAPKPGADYGELASKSIDLCGRILLKAVATEIPCAAQYIDKFYQVKAG